MAVTDGGAGLQILVTGGTAASPGQVITGTGRIQSAQGSLPAGSYGLLLNQWPDAGNVPQGSFAVFNLDGAGNLTGSYTAVGANVGPAPLSGTFTGTYSVNPDGTGSVALKLDIGASNASAIVVVDGGAGILMLQTQGGGGGRGHVTTGIARMQ